MYFLTYWCPDTQQELAFVYLPSILTNILKYFFHHYSSPVSPNKKNISYVSSLLSIKSSKMLLNHKKRKEVNTEP